MRCLLLPLLFLTACCDDGQGFEPLPEPVPEFVCEVCDERLISCGGLIERVAFVIQCEGEGCICEPDPCRSTGLLIVRATDPVCAMVRGL
jgi:hypothetical protein